MKALRVIANASTLLLLGCAVADFVIGTQRGGFSTELGRVYYSFGFYVFVVQLERWIVTKKQEAS